ncbi:hypothetical protein F5Y04DRAFT_141083 [Hypomontagnella monticulosa]|nr:hypothetical protein F5Y04DRAFT_141083 [Hypomontagnella monticulosa]
MAVPLDLVPEQISSLSPDEQQAIYDKPSLPPPAGVASNFDDPSNRNVLGLAVITTCLVITTISIVVRIYGKLFCVRKFMIEDYFAIAAFGTYVGCIYCCYWYLESIGYYVHEWDVRVRDFITLKYIIHILSNLYAVTMMIMKSSILEEWCRIFAPLGLRRKFFWTCRAIMAVNIAYYSCQIIAENLTCFPHRRIWDRTVPGSKCIDSKAMALAASAINVTFDFVILVLPQRIIWKLTMPLKRKIGISLVFTIGVLACVAATTRLVYTVIYYKSRDVTYTFSPFALCLLAEMTCMFLIFGGTVTPKIFTTRNPVSNFFASLTPLFRSRSATSAKASNRTNSSELSRREGSPKLEANGVPHTNLFSVIRPPSPTRDPSSDTGKIHVESGVVLTRHFSLREEYINKSNPGSPPGSHSQQTPWEISIGT